MEEGNYACVEAENMGNLVLNSQFCCTLTTSLKKIVFRKERLKLSKFGGTGYKPASSRR